LNTVEKRLKSLESPESSSPIITRSVSAGLAGEYCDLYEFPSWQRVALQLIGRFPQGLARFAISNFERFGGLKPSSIADLSIDQLVIDRLKDYCPAPKPYPCVVIGSALGGATAHLSMALGGPFLPQAFVLTLRGGSKDGDVQTYYEQSAGLVKKVASNNRGVLTIQHYDPVHDEWMTRYVNHLRFKLQYLPEAYTDFLERNLQAGGAVCYLDCNAKWLRYRVGAHSVFQVGGWGDISAQEFITGSDRLEEYRRQIGLRSCNWELAGFPIEEGPESEWGSEPGLGEALKDFCERKGYRYVPVSLSDPINYSELAFRSYKNLLAKEGRQPAGVLIEMFSQFDITSVHKSGLLPLWLVYNTLDNLNFLRIIRSEFPQNKPVFFSPLATFTHTPDLTPYSEWEKVLDGLDWQNIGARSSHYPADSMALTNWAKPLRAWVERNSNPIQSTLTPEDLQTLASEIISA
jgi:hypothetical protein